MKLRAPWLGAALLLTVAGTARAEVKDAADLLPAETLACVEIRQPDKLSREIAGLTKGSHLDDMPAVLAKFREKLPDDQQFFWFGNEVTSLSMFLSPELVNEGGRIQGFILGVTGVDKDGPQYVGVLLAGDSNFPTLYMRAYLTLGGSVRGVAEVEGVRIYRERRQHYEAPVPGAPPVPPKMEDSGPFMALLPGVVVFGSTEESVKDVLRRYKGKNTDPSLTNVAAFKEAAKLREKPGVFAYADMDALATAMDKQGKKLGLLQKQWEVAKAAINPKAVRGATASLTLQNGVLDVQARLRLDPSESSPLVDILAGGKGAGSDLLHFTPADGLLTLQLNLSDGEKRWEKALTLFDALDKASEAPEGETPTRKAIRDLEDQVKLRVGKDLLGKLTSAAVSADVDLPGEQRRGPQLVLEAVDADAAKDLVESGLPKLIGLIGRGAAPAAVKEEVDGRTLHTVSTPESMAWLSKSLYYGQEGKVVVVGVDRKRVSAALAAGAKKEGLLGDAKVAAALKDLDGPLAVGVLGTKLELVRWLEALETPPMVGVKGPGPGGPVPPPPPPGEKDKPPEAPKLSDQAKKSIEEMKKAVDPLPPLVFSLTRQPDGVVLELRQLGLKSVSTRAIDVWIDAALERAVGRNRFGP